MKMHKVEWNGLLVAGMMAMTEWGVAGELTAFGLIKEGNRYVGEQSKDRVVQIRSEKSVNTLTPNIWYIVYYDPDATFKAMEVKFAGGRKAGVKRAPRVFEPVIGTHKPLPKDKLKVDSDQAINVAIKEPIVDKLTLKATKLTLERWSEEDLPVWKVRLYAAKLKNPSRNVDIGEIFVSAVDAKVVKTDVHPNRVE